MQRRISTADTIGIGRAKHALRLNVSVRNGGQFSPRAAEGRRIMELIEADGFPIKAECRGGCVCSNCHVKVSAPWRTLLPPPSEEEQERLERLPGSDERSRLACQLLMTSGLDGLEIELQPESLALQTYWVAG